MNVKRQPNGPGQWSSDQVESTNRDEFYTEDYSLMTMQLKDMNSSEARTELQVLAHVDDFPASKMCAELELHNQVVKFQLDTGASCNVIGEHVLPKGLRATPTRKTLSLYDHSTIIPRGVHRTWVTNPRTAKQYMVEFVVVKAPNCIPLLGARTCQLMELISVHHENIQKPGTINSVRGVQESYKSIARGVVSKDDLLAEFSDLFDGGLGCFRNGQVNLDKDETVCPVRLPLRKVPVAVQKPLQDELKRLEELEVITREERPTDWLSSLVVAPKSNGKIRVCIDPKPLNKALKRSHHPTPVLDDFLHKLSRAKVFSVCDVQNGYWHVELNEESSLLTTFATPQGRYRWKRLPFGLSTAPEIFQAQMDSAISGLKGVSTIVDDMIIWGEGETLAEAEEDHDRNIRALFVRCRERGIKLHPDKFRYRMPEVAYVGHMLSANGLTPDPAKISAIAKMDKPTDKVSLLRFLGLVNYLAKFVAQLSDLSYPLRQLLQKESLWTWHHEHDKAVEDIKAAIVRAPVLKYFDERKEVIIQTDASSTGLGAVLLQDEQPVAYASRALTKTEVGYSQIEKEMLAVVFSLERFDHYAYGRLVTVHSDHKPLEVISRKPLLVAPKRLQRMLLRLQRYDYEIQYKPGREMLIADALSRAYGQSSAAQQTAFELHLETIRAVEDIAVAPSKHDRLREATRQDEALRIVMRRVKEGWPQMRKDVEPEARPYFNHRDELVEENGILLRGTRCIIPEALQDEVLQKIHGAHSGIEGCTRLAREHAFWPGMTAQVRRMVKTCDVCQAYSRKQQRETLQPTVNVRKPWSVVTADLLTFSNIDYLITTDYFSGFWEADRVARTDSSTIIVKLKQHFARYGIPDELRTDNGPQFSSREFKRFQQEWQFQHNTSSPRYPTSNGRSENAVNSAKVLMRKAKRAGTDVFLALLTLRNTPTQGRTTSPAQRLLNRRTKTTLPTHDSLLEPAVNVNAKAELDKSKARQKMYYDRYAKDLPELSPGDVVRIQPNRKGEEWKRAVVLECLGNRSYRVQADNGQIYRRNRRHLRYCEMVRYQPYRKEEHESEGAARMKEERIETGQQNATITCPNSPIRHNTPIRTRAGRTIRPPVWLKDYEQY